jgi:hypothetical protein
MARKRSSKINIENYVNGSPITPGVTYKLGDADTHTAWLLASSSPCLFKLSATAPTDELWSNITPEQFIINGSVAGQVIEIASPNGKYFVVPTNAQDKNASVESAHATIALHPLGFDYNQEYQALPLDGDGPVSEGFYKISNLESGKLYSINVHPDLGGLMETKPNPEFSYALFSVGADNNPKAFLAGGKTTAQLVFVATETSAILSIGSTIEEADYFVSIRNFSLGSGEGAGFDPSLDQNITGAWNFTNTAGLVLGNEVPLVLGQGDDAVKIRGNGNGAAVIEGTNASHMDVAIPVKFQNPTTFDDGISFVATTGEKMKCILFGKESGPTRAILYEESNGYLSVTDPNSINDRSMAFDGAGNLWFHKQENHRGPAFFYTEVRLGGFTNVTGTFTFSKTPNANAGVNIPLTVGAPTDTAAVNRFYALGLAGAMSALVQPIYLNSSSTTVTGSISKASNGTLAGLMQRFSVGAASADSNAYGSAVIPLIGPNGQFNYSSVCGFSLAVSATAFAKFTFGLGRGSKTNRTGLTMDSYSMIPGNDLAVNHGEIVDVTINTPYDTVRKGYEIRVREIFYVKSVGHWQVKTTTVFLPVGHNELMPNGLNRLIYMQSGPPSTAVREEKAALYMELGGGSTNTLFKIASLRGFIAFEAGTGVSTLIIDARNEKTYALSADAGTGTRHLYSNGLTNPTYHALEAMAVNAIESEETTDFEDINIPLEQA